MMESNVFQRTTTTDKIISDAQYNLAIGATLLWGFFINWVLVESVDPNYLYSINPFVFIILYFASAMYGIRLFSKSDDPLKSFIGYNFVVVPFGLIVNMVVSQYSPEMVSEAIQITGGVTLIMMILGAAYPAFFQRISGALTGALLAVIIVEMFQIFIMGIHSNWLDWAVAAIFCGYIGYDWGRANQIPKTLDNAVDSAAALYMDIINLFLRVLRIVGRRR
ncbi:MAG: Bax inhibitor-1 family protein [Candidatus Marinimicrobia bacterium]|nr:Bax inhibitor-1 family protein [Candidatus Neomarinimicrobiota bacterium]MCF7921768.1 Bax inhibitor-1 family protein [Candidatus Neomarinimicrobiota bacterium]